MKILIKEMPLTRSLPVKLTGFGGSEVVVVFGVVVVVVVVVVVAIRQLN